MTLLIVDDEPLVLQGVLNGVQWDLLDFRHILTARSDERAREILAEQPVDILLTDIEMVDKSGLDLIQWVNETRPEVKCIVLSCHDEFDFAQRAVRLECFDYVLKPVPYETLTQVLDRAQKRVLRERGQSLLERYGKEYVKKQGGESAETPPEDVLDAAERYIREHISVDISVEAVAKEAHVSPRHLNRLFQKRYGKPVSDYVTQQRMVLAAELLREPGISVTIVSDRVGYSNYSYFIKQFRKYHGMTPREYQKKQEQ